MTENLPASFSEIRNLIQTPKDVTLKAGDKTFPAHKKVLEIWSPYLKARFSEVWTSLMTPEVVDGKENDNKDAICELDEQYIDGDIVDDLLNFFYTSKVTLSTENAHSLCMAANYLNVSLLEVDCEKYLADNIDDKNVFDLWILANRLERKVLQNACLHHLCRMHFLATQKPISFRDDDWETLMAEVRNLTKSTKLYCFSSSNNKSSKPIISVINPLQMRSFQENDILLSFDESFSIGQAASGDKIPIYKLNDSGVKTMKVFDCQTDSFSAQAIHLPDKGEHLSSTTMNGNLYILARKRRLEDDRMISFYVLYRCDLQSDKMELSEVAAEPAYGSSATLVELDGRLYRYTPSESFGVYKRTADEAEFYEWTQLPDSNFYHEVSNEAGVAVASHAGRIFIYSIAGLQSYCPERREWTKLRTHCLQYSNLPKPQTMVSVMGKLWLVVKKNKRVVNSGKSWIIETIPCRDYCLFQLDSSTNQWQKDMFFESFQQKFSFSVVNKSA